MGGQSPKYHWHPACPDMPLEQARRLNLALPADTQEQQSPPDHEGGRSSTSPTEEVGSSSSSAGVRDVPNTSTLSSQRRSVESFVDAILTPKSAAELKRSLYSERPRETLPGNSQSHLRHGRTERESTRRFGYLPSDSVAPLRLNPPMNPPTLRQRDEGVSGDTTLFDQPSSGYLTSNTRSQGLRSHLPSDSLERESTLNTAPSLNERPAANDGKGDRTQASNRKNKEGVSAAGRDCHRDEQHGIRRQPGPLGEHSAAAKTTWARTSGNKDAGESKGKTYQGAKAERSYELDESHSQEDTTSINNQSQPGGYIVNSKKKRQQVQNNAADLEPNGGGLDCDGDSLGNGLRRAASEADLAASILDPLVLLMPPRYEQRFGPRLQLGHPQPHPPPASSIPPVPPTPNRPLPEIPVRYSSTGAKSKQAKSSSKRAILQASSTHHLSRIQEDPSPEESRSHPAGNTGPFSSFERTENSLEESPLSQSSISRNFDPQDLDQPQTHTLAGPRSATVVHPNHLALEQQALIVDQSEPERSFIPPSYSAPSIVISSPETMARSNTMDNSDPRGNSRPPQRVLNATATLQRMANTATLGHGRGVDRLMAQQEDDPDETEYEITPNLVPRRARARTISSDATYIGTINPAEVIAASTPNRAFTQEFVRTIVRDEMDLFQRDTSNNRVPQSSAAQARRASPPSSLRTESDAEIRVRNAAAEERVLAAVNQAAAEEDQRDYMASQNRRFGNLGEDPFYDPGNGPVRGPFMAPVPAPLPTMPVMSAMPPMPPIAQQPYQGLEGGTWPYYDPRFAAYAHGGGVVLPPPLRAPFFGADPSPPPTRDEPRREPISPPTSLAPSQTHRVTTAPTDPEPGHSQQPEQSNTRPSSRSSHPSQRNQHTGVTFFAPQELNSTLVVRPAPGPFLYASEDPEEMARKERERRAQREQRERERAVKKEEKKRREEEERQQKQLRKARSQQQMLPFDAVSSSSSSAHQSENRRRLASASFSGSLRRAFEAFRRRPSAMTLAEEEEEGEAGEGGKKEGKDHPQGK
ncbi:hypothetical protein AAE478_010264 [Parahypoxylon ruwenzoriense]